MVLCICVITLSKSAQNVTQVCCCCCKGATDEEIEAKLDKKKAERGLSQLLGSWTEMWAIM